MDVDKVSFYPLLLDILTDISEAHFVAVDLELSGVPSKGPNNGTGKPSLQRRYQETKEAAERYQILQFGLTCVQQDLASQKYILKPYNFDLSPIIAERGLDIERIFSFQSGAAEFLLKCGFDLGRPFYRGVPYLSRLEAKEARDKHAKRQDKSALADIQIKPTDTDALAFLERVRSEITAWLTTRTDEFTNYLDIAPVGAETFKDGDASEELSRFEKRLVHQLVRAEYPELVTISKRGYIQVVSYDKEREDKISADRKREMNERVNRQKGFRWVIEALLGSDLSRLDLRECARDPFTGEHVFADLDEYRSQFHRAHEVMRGNPRKLVGHNCFLDFVYIYRAFIGPLPDTVEEYQQKLHTLWFTIVDTKYMSTHNCGDISPASSLEQIAEQLDGQKEPVIELAPDHRKYETMAAFHEAGYDSYLTAQIAVRLSSKLEKEGAYVEVNGNGLGSAGKPGKHAPAKPRANGWSVATPATIASTNGTHTNDAAASEVSHLSITDRDAQPDEGFTPSNPDAKWKRQGDPSVPATHGADDPFAYDPKDLEHRYRPGFEGYVEGGMPRFDTDFWRVYGNKQRVFGTEEGVCVLSGGDADEDGDGVGVGQGGVEVKW
ncbi:hypothetical protein LTS09_016708 [Friedmanniomyces endolithicus]|nr:hypothetical protein LTS09_016708 [Friedmanniomyces endolithicus]